MITVILHPFQCNPPICKDLYSHSPLFCVYPIDEPEQSKKVKKEKSKNIPLLDKDRERIVELLVQTLEPRQEDGNASHYIPL